MVELRNGYCYPGVIFGVNVGLACVDGIIASLALSQLIRLQSRNSQHGWTRQKVFHLMIGSSNLGYFLYFVFALVTDDRDWLGWLQIFSFILMAIPEIIFFATFLLLLSFWIDLCHQVNDDDDDDECTYHEPLLERTSSRPNASFADSHRRCLPLWISNFGSRQKIVILVIISNAILMVVSTALMAIGVGESPFDPELVAQIYLAIFSVAMVVLGGALVRYGLLICLRMRRVRSERASDEMWKVGGLATVSVVCFTSSAVVSFLPDNPVLYNWNNRSINGVYAGVLLVLYYFAGSSIPSAFLLWIMRELPPPVAPSIPEESRTIAFISDTSMMVRHPQLWPTITTSQTQVIGLWMEGCIMAFHNQPNGKFSLYHDSKIMF